MCESYGTPSRGLMQVIPVSFHETDPEYYGRWTEPVDYAARAEAISETVKPRPEIAEIMEHAMLAGMRFADGGVLPSPTGRIKSFMSPGEYVLTPEQAREKAGEVLRRMTGMGSYTEEERAALDEGIRAQFEEEFDEYPEPPMVDPF